MGFAVNIFTKISVEQEWTKRIVNTNNVTKAIKIEND